MRKVELGDGISLGIPGNFPRLVMQEKDGVKSVSFSMKAHEGSKRFVSFFEIVLSDNESDVKCILPEEGYTTGKLTQEEFTIQGQKANLDSGELEITRPCGSKETATLYIFRFYYRAGNKYLTIVTYSMTKKGLLDILKTIECN